MIRVNTNWRTLLIAILAGCLLLSPKAHAQADLDSWSYILSPDPSPERSLLLDVAAVSDTDIWAVGSYDADPRPYDTTNRTLIQHWDGMRWSVVPSPNVSTGWNELEAVAVVAANDIWAAGYWSEPNGLSRALIEHWNGANWQVVPTPMPEGGAELRDISVVSANDIWAAGLRKGIAPEPPWVAYAIHWNGSNWTEVPTPSIGVWRNAWQGIGVVSANDIWLVGIAADHLSLFHTMAAHWDGTRWTVVATPNGRDGGELDSVAVVNSHDVWLTGFQYGDSYEPLFLHWNGTSLNPVPSPGGGVATKAIASNDIWSVGSNSVHWDGVQWNLVPMATIPNSIGEGFFGLTVVSPSEIWAVGRYYTADNSILTLTERFNASRNTGSVAGTLSLQECRDLTGIPVEFEFRPRNGNPAFSRSVSLTRTGEFALTDIPGDQYTMHVKGSTWLAANVTVDTTGGNVSRITALLRAGDANDDNAVDVLDLDLLLQAFDTVSGDSHWNLKTDFNGDGSADVLDLDLLLRNFDQQGDE